MSTSISGVYSAYAEPSAVVPVPVPVPVKAPVPVKVAPASPVEEDTVTLSQSAQVDKLNEEGASPAQIAASLQMAESTVDLDLGIVAATSTIPVTSVPVAAPAKPAAAATPAPATPAAATPVAAAPVAPAPAPEVSTSAAVKSASA
jgi:hypothetical protein